MEWSAVKERMHEVFEKVHFDRALFAFAAGFSGCAQQEGLPTAPVTSVAPSDRETARYVLTPAEYRERVKHHPFCAWIRSRSPEVLAAHGIDLATFEREASNSFTPDVSPDGEPTLVINSSFYENGIRSRMVIPEERSALRPGLAREFEIFAAETKSPALEVENEKDANVVVEMKKDIPNGRFATSTPEEQSIKKYPGGRLLDTKKVYVAVSGYLTREMKDILIDEPPVVQVAAYRLSANLAILHEVVGHGEGSWESNNHSDDSKSTMFAHPSLKISPLKSGQAVRASNRAIEVHEEDGSRSVVWVPSHDPKQEPLFMQYRAKKLYYQEVIQKTHVKEIQTIFRPSIRDKQGISWSSMDQ